MRIVQVGLYYINRVSFKFVWNENVGQYRQGFGREYAVRFAGTS